MFCNELVLYNNSRLMAFSISEAINFQHRVERWQMWPGLTTRDSNDSREKPSRRDFQSSPPSFNQQIDDCHLY